MHQVGEKKRCIVPLNKTEYFCGDNRARTRATVQPCGIITYGVSMRWERRWYFYVLAFSWI